MPLMVGVVSLVEPAAATVPVPGSRSSVTSVIVMVLLSDAAATVSARAGDAMPWLPAASTTSTIRL